jgi:hypothetical protein
VSGKQREARAAELLAAVLRSSDPERAAAGETEWLERAAETAERWQVQEDVFLARAMELMRRTEHARGAATRAANERARIERDRRREKERLRKNALARERYRERRLTEPARFDTRTGMHALAIEVDPVAYTAVRVEAARRGTAIPNVIGEIVRDASLGPTAASGGGPRRRQTGDGRRAKQHTRIAISNEDWSAVRVVAVTAEYTIGRWIGAALEAWQQAAEAGRTLDRG